MKPHHHIVQTGLLNINKTMTRNVEILHNRMPRLFIHRPHILTGKTPHKNTVICDATITTGIPAVTIDFLNVCQKRSGYLTGNRNYKYQIEIQINERERHPANSSERPLKLMRAFPFQRVLKLLEQNLYQNVLWVS